MSVDALHFPEENARPLVRTELEVDLVHHLTHDENASTTAPHQVFRRRRIGPESVVEIKPGSRVLNLNQEVIGIEIETELDRLARVFPMAMLDRVGARFDHRYRDRIGIIFFEVHLLGDPLDESVQHREEF